MLLLQHGRFEHTLFTEKLIADYFVFSLLEDRINIYFSLQIVLKYGNRFFKRNNNSMRNADFIMHAHNLRARKYEVCVRAN